MTTQIIDNHLGSCSVYNETVIATPMKADERVQIRNKKQPNVVKEKPVTQTVVERSNADHSDTSVVFHRFKESESSEPRTLG